ncbi:MAG: PAS domain S-box protein [Flavobacterium sp.]|nr:PAS domain S-box protein [Flavobacterium sp.]
MKNKSEEIFSDENLTENELLNLVKKQREIIKSLQKEEKNYRKLFENSIDGVYKSTLEGKFIDVSPSLVNMLGYDSKEELLGIDIKTELYFDIEDRKNNIQQNNGKIEEFCARKKDGSLIWVEDHGKNITDSNGTILYYEGIIRNVSERIKASLTQKVLLNISEEGYKIQVLKDFNEFIKNELGLLIDTTNFYIAFYNEDKQTINIPFISGEDADEEFPIGKSMTGYLIKSNKPLLVKSKEYNKLIESGEIELIGTFPKVWLGVPLRVNKKVIGAIVVQSYNDKNAYQQSDIELLEFVSSHISLSIQRKKIEQEIALSKQILRNVLDNIPIRVYWKNRESQFLGCNASFINEMSLDSENEIIGKTDFDIHEREDAEKFIADEETIMSTGKPKLKYQELNTRTGQDRWVLTSKLPFFDENNKVIGIIGTSDDITERIEIERKLKQATEEAIAANLSKSTFLSNMSHEIRTPMNAILGYSQLLQDDDNLTKAQQESLKTINKSGAHLLELINDILDMSKIEAGRVTLNLSDFNLIVLLKEVEELFKIKANQKNIDLSFTIAKNVPAIIYADESKIKQVIINLIGNSLKFTSQGFVKVSVEKLKNNDLQIKIKDTGKGILKEEQEAIFRPFEQAKNSRQGEGGTGLGLAISRKFSNLMEGDITIESEYGEGAEFAFTFKYVEGNESILKSDKEELRVVSLSPEMKGLKVAIVDDRFENRDILYKKLHPLGFDTRMAENGKEAVELYKEWKPDIILMDVVMPVMNGVEATRQILKIAGNHEVKIFVVSASALESEQKEVMEIGATVFIKKPVMFNLLLAEMHNKAGVKFIYQEEKKKETIKNSIPSDVPEYLKTRFLEASEEGDFALLQDLLETLEKETGKSFKFIEDCINEMEFEAIINWLKS